MGSTRPAAGRIENGHDVSLAPYSTNREPAADYLAKRGQVRFEIKRTLGSVEPNAKRNDFIRYEYRACPAAVVTQNANELP